MFHLTVPAWPRTVFCMIVLQDGRLPLHYAAARRETLPIYTALINAGQDALAVDSKEKNSEVSGDIVRSERTISVIQYYMEHGEEIQMPDKVRSPSLFLGTE